MSKSFVKMLPESVRGSYKKMEKYTNSIEGYKFLDEETLKILEIPMIELKEEHFNKLECLDKIYITLENNKHFIIYVDLKKIPLMTRLGRIAEYFKCKAIAKFPNSKYNREYVMNYNKMFERAY